MVLPGTSPAQRNHKRLLTADVSAIFRHFGLGSPTSHHPPPGSHSGDGEDPEDRASLISSLQSNDEGDEGERFVTYDTSSHMNILFQLHGSVWPRVLPYCVVNTILFWVVVYADSVITADLSVSSTGHSLTALLLAFLVIQRCGIVYNRFMNARHAVEDMNRICSEIVQIACIYSKHDKSDAAKDWRCRCAFTAILLLRTTVAALDYQSSHKNAWDILPDTNTQNIFSGASGDELKSKSEAEFLRESLAAMEQDRTGNFVMQKWAHGKRSVFHRNFKAPSVLAYRMRETVLQGREKINPKLQLLEEVQVMNLINAYVVDFQKLKAEISTPYPFPFVQMARTFLFVWVFSLPFVMARDTKNMVLATFLVFFATYGFMGLEFVSMEMDDPFGDDPNDFDDVALAQMTFEDIYITILKTDGIKRAIMVREAVKDLAKRSVSQQIQMTGQLLSTVGENESQATEQTPLQPTPLQASLVSEKVMLTKSTSILGIY